VTFEALPAILVTGAIAALMAFLLTPWAMRFATRTGAIDEPDSGRRIHVRPIPRAGGLAVAAAFVLVGLIALGLQWQTGLYATGRPWQLDRWLLSENEVVAVFGGAVLAAAFGFVDDKWQIRARWQLLFQVVLALFAIALGLQILEINNPLEFLGGVFADDTLVFEGVLAALVTGLWIVGMINSINFIDGLDGLSVGVAIIAALTLGFVSLGYESSYQPIVALVCAVLAGSLLGYLPWNFNPARVFVGTTGVMVMGYLLAVLAILGSAKVAVALLILGVPIIDTFWIITRRLLSGHSPFTPDRGHIHHRLLDLGLSHRGVVVLIYAITATLAVASVLLAGGSGPIYAFMAIVVGSGIVLLIITFRGTDEALEATTYDEDVLAGQAGGRDGGVAGGGRDPDEVAPGPASPSDRGRAG
jgi:UDP-GlcNAc:undecaprenyl-phosphate GlcNAc-1-phosphate transferase